MENDADQAGEPARDEGERVAICSREDADEEEGGGCIASVAAAAAAAAAAIVDGVDGVAGSGQTALLTYAYLRTQRQLRRLSCEIARSTAAEVERSLLFVRFR